jgi:membrane associated rhomboid family serine protease
MNQTTNNVVQRNLRGIAIFVAVLWAVWLIDLMLPIDLSHWGVVPRKLGGLIGIPLSPFIHGGIAHLLSNTVPLVVLLVLLLASRKDAWVTVAEIIVLGGVLLWLFGRSEIELKQAVHVGASGLIYGIIAYLIVAGFREKQIVSLGIALLVGFFYGGTFFWGMLPTQEGVSWDGHLTGALAGGILAMFLPTNPQNTADEKLS